MPASPTLFDDGTICLDVRGLTIRRYYFPFGSKRIPTTSSGPSPAGR